jgi:aspartate racemase
MEKTIGIIGGMGPLATCDLFRKIIDITDATCDQEHIRVCIDNNTEIPDRTAAIVAGGKDPVEQMSRSAKGLQAMGADVLIMPCNTAHYFYERIAAASTVPVINIIRETVDFCVQNQIRCVGVLATEGTVYSGAYEEECRRAGVGYLTCSPEEQTVISRIIYDEIKKGQAPDLDAFRAVADALRQRGAEAIILGCTELSLLKKRVGDELDWIDSLEVLACAAIRMCGKEPIGFDERLMKFTPRKEQYYAVE